MRTALAVTGVGAAAVVLVTPAAPGLAGLGTLGGAAIGAVAAILSARRARRGSRASAPSRSHLEAGLATLRRPGDRVATRRARAAWSVGRALVATAVVVAGVVMFVASSAHLPSHSFRPPQLDGGERRVFAVDYHARFSYDSTTAALHGREVVRLGHAGVVSTGLSPRRPGPDSYVGARALGEGGWTYDGRRGPGGAVQAFVRERTVPVFESSWYRHPLRLNHVAVVPFGPSRDEPELVPADGSVVELRAPDGLIHATDPGGERREFGGEDIVAIRLEGMEDDPDRTGVEIQVANSLGRSSFYAELSSVTAGSLVKGLLLIVIGAVAGFFVNRFLAERL